MFTPQDTAILRPLATRVAQLAQHPRNDILRQLWRDHTSLRGERPMIFVSPEGSWRELLPQHILRCQDAAARSLEYDLRQRIYRAEMIADDVPIKRTVLIPRAVLPINAGWGLVPRRVDSTAPEGAWAYEPVVQSPADWKKLKKPQLDIDEQGVQARFLAVQEAVGDILDVRLTDCTNFSFHMMHIYCDFRGLSNMMLDLYDEPEMVHDVIAFLTDGMQGLLDELRQYNLIDLNTGPQYHYTGGLGYTHDLPQPDFDPAHVRTVDVWGAAEAQEFAQISPDMHEEFILQYERKLLENFGLNGYGCCDDLTHKLDNVLKIRNLRRVAVCPWADVEQCANRLGRDYIMTWKPQPAYLAGETYDAAFVEDYLTRELQKGAHGRMEIILRDTHTCHNDPRRFTQFVASARNAIQRVHGMSEHLWV